MPPIPEKQLPPNKVSSKTQSKEEHSNVLDEIKDVTDIKNLEYSIVIYGDNGVGKCLGKGTPVLMYDGTIKSVEDIVPGDILMGPGSKPRNVLTTTVGKGPLCRIVPTKGDSWICNYDHILTLTGCKGVRGVDGKTVDISVKDYLNNLDNKAPYAKFWCLMREGVDFKNPQELYVPPYLVGLWMGDGTHGSANISNNKQIIQDYCKKVAHDKGLICYTQPDGRPSNPTTKISFVSKLGSGGVEKGSNKFLTFFRDECSNDITKKIPQRYLCASREDRMELLAGIIDTDGEERDNPSTVVTVTGEQYRDDLLFLVRSLGFASYSDKGKKHICTSGKISTYYKVSVIGDIATIPTKIRKYDVRVNTKRVNVTRFAVEDMGEGNYYGFTLDSDGRFLLGDFTVTHNTSLAAEWLQLGPTLLIGLEPNKTGGMLSVGNKKGLKFIKVDNTEKYVALITQLKNLKPFPFKTVILDGATAFQDIKLKEILGREQVIEQINFGEVSDEQYRKRSEQAKEATRMFLNLPCHTIVIVKEKDINRDKNDRRPDVVKKNDSPNAIMGFDLSEGFRKWLYDTADSAVRLTVEPEVIEVEKEFILGNNKQKKKVKVETGKDIRKLQLKVKPFAQARLRSQVPDKVPDFITGLTPDELFRKLILAIVGEYEGEEKVSEGNVVTEEKTEES